MRMRRDSVEAAIPQQTCGYSPSQETKPLTAKDATDSAKITRDGLSEKSNGVVAPQNDALWRHSALIHLPVSRALVAKL